VLNQAVKRGVERQKSQPGSVTFIQRFGSAINLNVHYHIVFLEGVYLDRTDQGLKLRFVKGAPPCCGPLRRDCRGALGGRYQGASTERPFEFPIRTARAELLQSVAARRLAAVFPQLGLKGLNPCLEVEDEDSQRIHQGKYGFFALHVGGMDICWVRQASWCHRVYCALFLAVLHWGMINFLVCA
jgi:putative transposase